MQTGAIQNIPQTPMPPPPQQGAGGQVPFERTGFLRVVSNTQMAAQEQRAAAEAQQNQPEILGLANHIRNFFYYAQRERMTVEGRMHQNLRARNGMYDPEVLAEIKKAGGSEIYMTLTSVKCRSAAAWLRDVYLGSGSDKPWTLNPTPDPEIPPQYAEEAATVVGQEVAEAMSLGIPVMAADITRRMAELKDMVDRQVKEQARKIAARMENFMEDQLVEGGFIEAFHEFLDDLTVYPAAIIKGPVIRKKRVHAWVQGPQGWTVTEKEALVKQWERVDPTKFYPHPHSTDVDDGPTAEIVPLTRSDLNAMIGAPGYSAEAIRQVLEEHGRGGLQEWTTSQSVVNALQDKPTTYTMNDAPMDAVVYFGSVMGKDLVDWGMAPEKVADPMSEYEVEAWLIGRWVIKAVLNERPTGCKPYFKDSFSRKPGSFWGDSTADLIRDPAMMCNAAARTLVNNMGLASGPQVGYNVTRMPNGENITSMYPWKIWQFTSDPMGSTAPPLEFFQPQSLINELILLFDKFSAMADEFSGVPKYMTGSSEVGGAGRTASGLSMLINNAGKTIKQVALSIDTHVLTKLLQLLFYYNMKYEERQDIKGDLKIVAKGAASIIAKEAIQLRRNEFLQVTANPFDMQIMGQEGRAAVLREMAKGLEMNVDDIVPSRDVLIMRAQVALAQQQMANNVEFTKGPDGAITGARVGGGDQLQNGAPATDNFSPSRANAGGNGRMR